MAPSLSAACGCASPSTFMSLKNTFCRTVAPTSRKIGALCQGRSFLHPATARARRPRTSSWAWPLRHLQRQTELADQRSEQMWWDGELKARGTASQSGSRIPPRVGTEVSPSSSSAAGQHGNLPVVRVRKRKKTNIASRVGHSPGSPSGSPRETLPVQPLCCHLQINQGLFTWDLVGHGFHHHPPGNHVQCVTTHDAQQAAPTLRSADLNPKPPVLISPL